MTDLNSPHAAGPEQPEPTFRPGALTAGRATAVLDERMRFIGWSPEAESLFGHRPKDVLGRHVDAVLADTVTGAGFSPSDGGPGTPSLPGHTASGRYAIATAVRSPWP